EKRGLPVHLQDKPFKVLALLLRNAGEVVSREELRRKLWNSETFVEFDEGVNAAVGKLRYELGDSADSPLFVETVRGKGYRWVAPIEWVGGNGASASEQHAISKSDPCPSQRQELSPPALAFPLKTWFAAGVLAACLIFLVVVFRLRRDLIPP